MFTDRGLHGPIAPLALITPVAMFAACVAALHWEDWFAGADFEHPPRDRDVLAGKPVEDTQPMLIGY